MSPLSPPFVRGRISTTPARLFLAAAVMFVLDLPLVAVLVTAMPIFHAIQVVVMIGVLLLSSRRWIAALLLLVLTGLWFVFYGVDGGEDASVAWFMPTFALGPLWIGTFIAFPRPRKRVVYVEEE